MEISRWRQPPDPHPTRNAPRRGAGLATHPPPLPGRRLVWDVFRWFTPPANFRPSLRDSAPGEVLATLAELEKEIAHSMRELETMMAKSAPCEK